MTSDDDPYPQEDCHRASVGPDVIAHLLEIVRRHSGDDGCPRYIAATNAIQEVRAWVRRDDENGYPRYMQEEPC